MASKQQLQNYAAQSAFVFSGKVIKLKASTVHGIDTSKTAVVEINHVVNAPSMFAAMNGQQVTVRLKSLAGVTKGSNMTFFTNGWIYGDSLAVDAVACVKTTQQAPMALSVQEGVGASDDGKLKERLDSAAMAVAGQVSKVAQSGQRTTRISEHNPDWHEATIDVHEVMKGKKSAKKVKVLFPKSDDIRWYKSAKYTEGQQGIWLLQPGKKQAPKGIAPKAFAAIPEGVDVMTSLHPVDFLPLHELGRVKSLLAN